MDALIGKKMPSFRISNWVNGPVKQTDLNGKILVIDFWATWCKYCIEALPKTNKLYERYKDEDVIVTAICSSSGQSKMHSILKSGSYTMPIGRDRSSSLSKFFKVSSWPTYAVVGKDGKIVCVGIHSGYIPYVIEDLLEKERQSTSTGYELQVGKNPFPDEWFYRKGKQRAKYDAMIGKPMTETLNVSDWFNGKITAEQIKDKISVIKFWSTKRSYSIRSIKDTNKLYKKYKDKGINVFGICGNSDLESYKITIPKYTVQFPTAFDPQNTTANAWNVNYWPTYFVIDSQGKVVAAGMRPNHVEDVLKATIEREKQLNQPPPLKIDLPKEWFKGDEAERKQYASMVGKLAPGIRLNKWHNTNGNTRLRLEDLKGKIVLVDFWGAGFPYCIKTIPRKNELMEKYKDQGLVILGVCVSDKGEKMVQVMKDHDIQYPIAWDEHGTVFKAYKSTHYPAYFIIGRDGNILAAGVNDLKIEDAIKTVFDVEKQ
ncbi:TlpA family protein disulfide reductase [Planctomycetota bacterium]|nr:TlpA family protein disulfide reductase [Planctomycetota bacterium]